MHKTLPLRAEAHRLAPRLSEMGIIVLLQNNQCYLTEKGLKQVRPAAVLSRSTLVMETLNATEKPLSEMDHCELLAKLRREDFHWQPVPRRGLVPFRVGGPRVYYCNGPTERALPRSYLQCLLHVHEGQEPRIEEVAYGLGSKAYEALLAGRELPVVVRLRELNVDADTLLEGQDLPANPGQEADEEDESSDSSESVMIEEDPLLPDGAEVDIAHRRHNHNWGPFRITVRRNMLDNGDEDDNHGILAWTARCPFHKVSPVTGCKRSLNVGRQSSEVVLRLLYHWCNHAAEHSRKRDHAAMPLDIVPPPQECPSVVFQNRQAKRPSSILWRGGSEQEGDVGAGRGWCRAVS